jgi:hypothetical protein
MASPRTLSLGTGAWPSASTAPPRPGESQPAQRGPGPGRHTGRRWLHGAGTPPHPRTCGTGGACRRRLTAQEPASGSRNLRRRRGTQRGPGRGRVRGAFGDLCCLLRVRWPRLRRSHLHHLRCCLGPSGQQRCPHPYHASKAGNLSPRVRRRPRPHRHCYCHRLHCGQTWGTNGRRTGN